MKEESIEYVDDSLTNCCRRTREFRNGNDNTVTSESRRDELPESIMAELEDHVGDGLARVTVSGDLSSSVEYHGAKAFVSISVACNNDMDDIHAVHDLLLANVGELVEGDHADMSLRRDNILSPGKRSQEKRRPPVKTTKVAKGKAAVAQGRSSRIVPPKGAVKPSFRR